MNRISLFSFSYLIFKYNLLINVKLIFLFFVFTILFIVCSINCRFSTSKFFVSVARARFYSKIDVDKSHERRFVSSFEFFVANADANANATTKSKLWKRRINYTRQFIDERRERESIKRWILDVNIHSKERYSKKFIARSKII